MRAEADGAGEKPRYDGRCRDRRRAPPGRGPGGALPEPAGRPGGGGRRGARPVVFDNAELDDLIIARSDGTPTYNFTVVVDDADMGITHVIRGDDHLNNTPRQINMLRRLGRAASYAHLPMINGPDGAKLSKRHGAVNVLRVPRGGLPARGAAELPGAARLVARRPGDLLARGDDRAVRHHRRQQVGLGFNPDKLVWVNQQHPARVAEGFGSAPDAAADGGELPLLLRGLRGIDPAAAKKHLRAVILEPLQDLAATARELEAWSEEGIDEAITACADDARHQHGQAGPAGAGGGHRRPRLAAHRRDPGAGRQGTDAGAAPRRGRSRSPARAGTT
jgi:hypothetical protein